MAIEKVVNITVNTKGSQQAIAQTEKLNQKFKQLQATTGELKTGLKESSNAVLENGGAMGLLNDLTGGMAMTVKDAVEATALFTKGTTIATTAQKVYTLVVGSTTGALKALRIALVSTGLGAIVVILGLFISKMMESADATEEMERAQVKLNLAFEASNEIYKDQIDLIDQVTKANVLRAKIAGKSEKELRDIEKAGAEEKFKALKDEQNRLLALQAQKGKSVEDQKKINDALLKNSAEFNKLIADENNKALENELTVVDAKRASDKAYQEELLENQRKANEEKKKAELEYKKSLQEGLNEFQIAVNNAEFEQRLVDIENRKEQADQIAMIAKKEADEEIAEAERVKRQKAIIEQQKIDIVNNTLGIINALAKKGSAVSKALAITEIVRSQVKSVSQSLSALTTANAVAVASSPLTAGQPFVGINTAQTLTGIALSAVGAGKAIKDILSDSKSVSGGGAGSQSGGATPSAPSFNIVAGTGSNQIAQGLSSNKAPIKAFVVSSEQRTAEALDRNIVSEASI